MYIFFDFYSSSVYVYVYVWAQSFSHIQFFVAPWSAACQAPLSVEFSRQEYWSGSPFPISEDLPNPGIEPRSLVPTKVKGNMHSFYNRIFQSVLNCECSLYITTGMDMDCHPTNSSLFMNGLFLWNVSGVEPAMVFSRNAIPFHSVIDVLLNYYYLSSIFLFFKQRYLPSSICFLCTLQIIAAVLISWL